MKHRFARVKQLQQQLADKRGEGRKLSLEIDTLDATPDDKKGDKHDEARKAKADRVLVLRGEIEKLDAELASETDKLERDHIFEAPEPRQTQLITDETARQHGARPQLERWGWRDMGEFAQMVVIGSRPGGPQDARFAAAMERMRAAPTNFHESSGTEGYMVPPAFRQEIYELVFNGQDLVNMVDTDPTDSNVVGFIADESTPWGSSGVQAYWRGEGQQMTATKLATKFRTLTLHELYAFVLGTSELLEDATRLAARLTRRAAMAIRWKASEAVMTGNGAGQPLGWMSSAARVTVAKEAGQAAATINTTNIAKMFSRLLTGAGGRPFWLANSDIVPQLVGLTIGDQPVWTQPQGGLRDAPGGSIMGYPIVWSEHSETLGTEGDLTLMDGMGYFSPQKRSGLQFASSIHLYFDYNIEAFRWTFRMGGQPYLSAPVSPAKGAATKAHFVTLATRS